MSQATLNSQSPSTKSATTRPSLTFTTGIEAGGMEGMTVALVQSLRRWGGRFADCPFIAVQPRFGPPISRATLHKLDELNVTFVKAKPTHDMSWFVWMNKPTTLLEAERRTNDDAIAWLDADMLVLSEPEELDLGDSLDFVACAADKNAGTAGPEDPFEPYWHRMAQQFDLDVQQLPWVTAHRENAPIRLYFNAGLFVYRRSTGFAATFMQRCQQLLRARLASVTQGIVLTDQVALGLTMHSMGLRWKNLPLAYNHPVSAKLHRARPNEPHLYTPEAWADVKVLHYHDALWPKFKPTLLADMQPVRPDVAAFIAALPPLAEKRPLHWKVLHKAMWAIRNRQYRKYEATCERY